MKNRFFITALLVALPNIFVPIFKTLDSSISQFLDQAIKTNSFETAIYSNNHALYSVMALATISFPAALLAYKIKKDRERQELREINQIDFFNNNIEQNNITTFEAANYENVQQNPQEELAAAPTDPNDRLTKLEELLTTPQALMPNFVKEKVKQAHKKVRLHKNEGWQNGEWIKALFDKKEETNPLDDSLKEANYKKEFLDQLKQEQNKQNFTEVEAISVLCPVFTYKEIKGIYNKKITQSLRHQNQQSNQAIIVQGLDAKKLQDCYLGKNADEHFVLILVASQDDYGESVSPDKIFPVQYYIWDPTQGPACSRISAYAALIRRHLFAYPSQSVKELCIFYNILPMWVRSNTNAYRNGYFMPKHLQKQTAETVANHIKENIDKLNLMYQPVICERTLAQQQLLFCAAPSFQGEVYPPNVPENRICKEIVIPQYLAAAMIAIAQSIITGKIVHLHVTFVGRGAFNNLPEVTNEGIDELIKIIKGYNVILWIHDYAGTAIKDMQHVIKKHNLPERILSHAEFLNIKTKEDLESKLGISRHDEALSLGRIKEELLSISNLPEFAYLFSRLKTPAFKELPGSGVHSTFITNKLKGNTFFYADALAIIYMMVKDLSLASEYEKYSHFYSFGKNGIEKQIFGPQEMPDSYQKKFLKDSIESIEKIRVALNDQPTTESVLTEAEYVTKAYSLGEEFKAQILTHPKYKDFFPEKKADTPGSKFTDYQEFIFNKISKIQYNSANSLDAAAELVAVGKILYRAFEKSFNYQEPFKANRQLLKTWKKYYLNEQQNIQTIAESKKAILDEFETLIKESNNYLENIKSPNNSQENACPFCLEAYRDAEEGGIMEQIPNGIFLTCQHANTTHKSCLKAFYEHHSKAEGGLPDDLSCPLCRGSLNTDYESVMRKLADVSKNIPKAAGRSFYMKQ